MNIATLFAHGHDVDTPALINLKNSSTTVQRTRRELLGNVGNLCASLRALGLRPEDRIMILSVSTTEAIETVLAAFNIGATAVPVNPLLGTPAIESIVRRLQPVCCVFEDNLTPEMEAVLRISCRVLISMKPPAAARASDWRHYPSLTAGLYAPFDVPDCDGRQTALIVHSSGSEGLPKLIRLSHDELATFFHYHDLLYSQLFDDTLHRPEATPVISVLPVNHLGGLAICLHGLITGRPTYLVSLFIPAAYLALLERTRCQVIMLVPSMYRALLKEPRLPHADLTALKFCITMGEPCTAALAGQIEDAFRATVVSAYGLTECFTGIGHLKADLLQGRGKPGSCGKHCFGEIKLLGEDGTEHPEFGELWVRNPTVHACYLDPALNEERLREGWFRTKDLFYRDPDGYFFHRGRCDDMFICNGKNIYPADIEKIMASHPAVELACAAPVTDGQSGHIPAVLILARTTISGAALMDFAAKNGPAHAVPRLVEFTSDMPRVGPGKINRLEAARQLQSAYDRSRSA